MIERSLVEVEENEKTFRTFGEIGLFFDFANTFSFWCTFLFLSSEIHIWSYLSFLRIRFFLFCI